MGGLLCKFIGKKGRYLDGLRVRQVSPARWGRWPISASLWENSWVSRSCYWLPQWSCDRKPTSYCRFVWLGAFHGSRGTASKEELGPYHTGRTQLRSSRDLSSVRRSPAEQSGADEPSVSAQFLQSGHGQSHSALWAIRSKQAPLSVYTRLPSDPPRWRTTDPLLSFFSRPGVGRCK